MADVNVTTLAVAWDDALQTRKESSILDTSKLVFELSASAVRLDTLGDDRYEKKLDIDTKKETCLTLLTKSLLQNSLESLEEI